MTAAIICLSVAEILFTVAAQTVPIFKKHGLASKMLCSCTFVIIGILCFIKVGASSFAIAMLAGLCFGCLGDFFLGLSMQNTCFAVGVGFFFLGHLAYSYAFFLALEPQLTDRRRAIAIIFIVIAVPSALAMKLVKVVKIDFGKFAALLIPYSLIILFMFSSALVRAYLLFSAESGVFACLLFFGALLFTVSDSSLALAYFGVSKHKLAASAVHPTYFSAQLLLALSIFFAAQ